MTATTTVTGSPDKAPDRGPAAPARQLLQQDRARRTGSPTASSASCWSPARSVSLLLILLAIFAPLIAPYSFDTYQDAAGPLPARRATPTVAQPLGHDRPGLRRDVAHDLRRAHRGRGRASSPSSSRSSSACRSGLVSGYVGGWLDRILVLIMDALFAFPYLLLAIVAAFLLKDTIDSGIVVTAIAITVVYVPQYFRVVRASTLSAREATYIEAARAMGAQPAHDHPQVPVRQRRPERAGDRDAERRRRDPHARRPRLPRPRHPARRRPPSGAMTSSARSPTPAPASGGRRSSPASAS